MRNWPRSVAAGQHARTPSPCEENVMDDTELPEVTAEEVEENLTRRSTQASQQHTEAQRFTETEEESIQRVDNAATTRNL